MSKGSPSTQKIELRKRFEEIRKTVHTSRRKEAAAAVAETFSKDLSILSFFSFGTEIDTSLLNADLAKKGLLFLPRIERNQMVPYRVFRLEDTVHSHSYPILEPDPDRCDPVSSEEIQVVLVPGLAFDSENYRLGYGKGYYDRFLIHLKVKTIGIGFQEQLSPTLLPRDTWDLPVEKLVLF